MKKCSYCGRENPDEAMNCSGCGQNEFKVEAPPVVPSPTEIEIKNKPAKQKNLLLRVLIAVSVGIIISTISIYVAWANSGNASAGWWEQWETQRALKDMGQAAAAYQEQYKVVPNTFEQLKMMTNAIPEMGFWSFRGFTDGWQHPYVISNEGTNCLIISYGHDGKPGGKGIDYDLTSKNPRPKEAWPTFAQFWENERFNGMIGSSIVCGILAGFLSLLTVRIPNLNKRGIIILVFSLCATLVGTLFVTVMITAVHVPSGH